MPNQVVANSGDYRPCCCFLQIDTLEIGEYVLIASTFEPNCEGQFQIHIASEQQQSDSCLDCIELPPEGHGMDLIPLQSKWDSSKGTAAGCVNYGCYTFNPKFLLHVTQDNTQVFVRLSLLIVNVEESDLIPPNSSSSSTSNPNGIMILPSINVSVYKSNEKGDLLVSSRPDQALFTSDAGVYTRGNASGVRTPMITLQMGYYVILPSTYDPIEYNFELKVYSSKHLAINVKPLYGKFSTLKE
jgi:hypothetical protein